MFVKFVFVLILCVSNCCGLLDGKDLDPGNRPRKWQDLETFVHQKFEDMERLLTERDESVNRLESILTNQKTDMAQLKQGMESLEQEILHKNGIVDNLQNRVRDLEMAMLFVTVQRETESRQHGDSLTLINETAFLRHSDRSPQLTNTLIESSLRNNIRPYSQSWDENLTDPALSVNNSEHTENEAEDASRAPIPIYGQKRVAPSSQIPKQRVAFHVVHSRDKYYHQENTVVFDLEKLDHGNGYNSADGIYTAPESGTYVFTWKLICEKHHYFKTVLVVNGVSMGSSITDASRVDIYDQSTSVVVTTLNQGDHVFIRMGSDFGNGWLLSRDQVGEPTFSGWKLD